MANRSVVTLSLRLLVALVLAAAPQRGFAADAPPLAEKSTASQENEPAKLTADVVLHEGRYLIGQLVDASGKPAAETEVRLLLADGRTAESKTNPEGGFAFEGVRGVAKLQTDKATLVARCWTKEAAPPNATPAVLLVEDGEVTRGQRYAGAGAQGVVSHTKRLFANPFFVAGVVGTAVAVPVAIHNSDDDDPAS